MHEPNYMFMNGQILQEKVKTLINEANLHSFIS
jgi:hypothetical protein